MAKFGTAVFGVILGVAVGVACQKENQERKRKREQEAKALNGEGVDGGTSEGRGEEGSWRGIREAAQN